MRLNGLCVDEGGRIARRLALVNSVVFRVMRHRSPHVLHPLATHFSTGPCLPFQVISGLCFIFDALSAASHLRVTPPPNPSPHGLAEPLKEIFRRGQDPQRSLSRGGF